MIVPGYILQNYRILSKLGEGGMGEIWKAEHLSIDRKVAIKVLHAQYARNEAIRKRFRNEALALSKLEHPNIVRVYDLIEEDGMLCIVLEYVEGRNLDDLVRNVSGPLPPEQLGAVFKQILAAVAYAHEQGVIHRDIKPSNFMLTADGTVKVLDFGIAKVIGADEAQLTRTGTRMGTANYMSPEQVMGAPLDLRTDIYSLGVTLFVLATGRNPYEGEEVEFKVYNRIVHEPLPPARQVYHAVSPNVEALIQKATTKDPRHRFQTCGEFLVGKGINLQQQHAPQNQAGPNNAAIGSSAGLNDILQSQPVSDEIRKEYKSLRTYAIVSIVGGVVMVPLFFGFTSLIGAGVCAGITVCGFGVINRNKFTGTIMPIMLGIHGLFCVLLLLGSLQRRTFTFSSTMGPLSYSNSMQFTGDSLIFLGALVYVAIGLWLLLSRKGRRYFA